MYNCTIVSQDTRLEVTSDPGLGTFPSNPLSQSILKLNSIASCVTGTQTGHTRARGDHKPRWWSSLRKSIPQSTIPWRQGSSRHHPSPGFTMIGTRYPCNCIKECREIRTTSARSKNLGQVFLPYTTFLWSHILQRRDLIIKLNCREAIKFFSDKIYHRIKLAISWYRCTGENLVMNDFCVSRSGGLWAGPKWSCWTILKSLKLDTDQPRSGRSRQRWRK